MSNPYTLRAGLLAQAEGILMQRFQIENDRIRNSIQLNLEKDKTFDVNAVVYPKAPTTDDIIAEAEKLYSFVQKK